MSLGGVALVANAAASTLNSLFYLTPLRNDVIKLLFGLPPQDVTSPIAGTLMHLGGLNAAVAIQAPRN